MALLRQSEWQNSSVDYPENKYGNIDWQLTATLMLSYQTSMIWWKGITWPFPWMCRYSKVCSFVPRITFWVLLPCVLKVSSSRCLTCGFPSGRCKTPVWKPSWTMNLALKTAHVANCTVVCLFNTRQIREWAWSNHILYPMPINSGVPNRYIYIYKICIYMCYNFQKKQRKDSWLFYMFCSTCLKGIGCTDRLRFFGLRQFRKNSEDPLVDWWLQPVYVWGLWSLLGMLCMFIFHVYLSSNWSLYSTFMSTNYHISHHIT